MKFINLLGFVILSFTVGMLANQVMCESHSSADHFKDAYDIADERVAKDHVIVPSFYYERGLEGSITVSKSSYESFTFSEDEGHWYFKFKRKGGTP